MLTFDERRLIDQAAMAAGLSDWEFDDHCRINGVDTLAHARKVLKEIPPPPPPSLPRAKDSGARAAHPQELPSLQRAALDLLKTLDERDDVGAIREAVKSFVGTRGLGSRFAPAIAYTRALSRIRDLEYEALERRIAALEQREPRGMSYEGTFEEGATYRRDAVVTYHGSMWVARRDDPGVPGAGDGWQLAVRKGRDARDRR